MATSSTLENKNTLPFQLTGINQQKTAIQKSNTNLNGYYFLTTEYGACIFLFYY